MPDDAQACLIYTTLGSGTLRPSDQRRSACHLVQVDGARLLLDCGFGSVHGFARHGVDWARLTHLVFSHYHTDHMGDLAPYLFALTYGLPSPRSEPLTVIGPPGLGRVLDGLAQAHGDFVREPPFPLEVVEVARADHWSDPAGRFELACHPTPHTPESVCWKVETRHGVLGYSGDTGPDTAVGRFLAGSTVVVCECALPDGSDLRIHLTPGRVAELAGLACPELLLLTHVYPPLIPDETPRLVRAAGYQGTTRAAADGDRVMIRDGQVVPLVRGAF
jgi:ribonuclease BN (tRNA processing enzyme)